MPIKNNHMDESAKIAITTVQVALGIASCNFLVAVQFFPIMQPSIYTPQVKILFIIILELF